MLKYKLSQSPKDVGYCVEKIFAPVLNVFLARCFHSVQLREVVKRKNLEKNSSLNQTVDAEQLVELANDDLLAVFVHEWLKQLTVLNLVRHFRAFIYHFDRQHHVLGFFLNFFHSHVQKDVNSVYIDAFEAVKQKLGTFKLPENQVYF